MTIPIIFTDGGCSGNPGPMGVGVVVTVDGKVIDEISEFPTEPGTNNIAEYMGIIAGLKAAIKHKFPEIILKSDSQLCVNQLSKGWKINQEHLRILNREAKELEKYVKVTYEYIPRAGNLADKLCNMSR